MRKTIILAALFATNSLLTATSSANAAAYTFTTIDVPGAPGTIASDINDAGQIVGLSAASSPTSVFPHKGFY